MGRRLYEYATRILKEVAEAEQGMKALKGIITGHVRVGLMPTFTRAIFPPAVLAVQRQVSAGDISVVEAYSAQLTKDVLQGMLDFAIVPATPDALQAGLRGQPHGHRPRVPGASRRDDGRTAHGDPSSSRAKRDLKLILPSAPRMPADRASTPT